MSKQDNIAAALQAPFTDDDIEWRIQSSGATNTGKHWARAVAYVTARAAQQRFDSVLGPMNWTVHYEKMGTGWLASVGVRVDGGDWTFKVDGAEETEFESFKGGLSSAFKRTASVWGVGRYLYKLPVVWAEVTDKRTPNKISINKKWLYWVTPKMPPEFLPPPKPQTNHQGVR